jgi:hypothetical protein
MKRYGAAARSANMLSELPEFCHGKLPIGIGQDVPSECAAERAGNPVIRRRSDGSSPGQK